MIIIIVIAAATIGYDIYLKKKENEVVNNLTRLIVNKQYKQFDEIIDSKDVKKYFAKFNHLFLKLNKEVLVNNTEKAEQIMEQLNATKLSNRQKEAFYSKAFYYFIAKEDDNQAKKYHDLYMSSCKNNKEDIDCVFNTMVEKGYKYLDTTLQKLQGANQTTQIQLYSLISTMYENKGDIQKAEEYTDKLKDLIDKISKK